MIDKQLILKDLAKNYVYDPDTGYFTRIKKTGSRNCVGYVAGSKRLRDNYIMISLSGKPYNAHRIAWLYMTGEWPKDQIDHINRIKSDNRFSNLRECTAQQNSRNTATSNKNKSGYKCVHWRGLPKKWAAGISVGGEYIELGLFDCRHDAARAYNAKAKEVDSEFCYLNEVPS